MIIMNMFYQYFTVSTNLGAHVPHIHVSPSIHSDNDKISPEQWGASIEDEVAIGDHGVVPLPMGIEEWMDMRERVYRPTRGPWQHIGGEF